MQCLLGCHLDKFWLLVWMHGSQEQSNISAMGKQSHLHKTRRWNYISMPNFCNCFPCPSLRLVVTPGPNRKNREVVGLIQNPVCRVITTTVISINWNYRRSLRQSNSFQNALERLTYIYLLLYIRRTFHIDIYCWTHLIHGHREKWPTFSDDICKYILELQR